jgi:hypothetical protein
VIGALLAFDQGVLHAFSAPLERRAVVDAIHTTHVSHFGDVCRLLRELGPIFFGLPAFVSCRLNASVRRDSRKISRPSNPERQAQHQLRGNAG